VHVQELDVSADLGLLRKKPTTEFNMKTNSKRITTVFLALFLVLTQASWAKSHEHQGKDLGKKLDKAEAKAKQEAEKAKEKAKEVVEETKDKTKELAEDAKEKSQELHDKAKEKAQKAVDNM
jgi:hypothetical protein